MTAKVDAYKVKSIGERTELQSWARFVLGKVPVVMKGRGHVKHYEVLNCKEKQFPFKP
jgi:hypothetical protein